jgi:hypothetical protein
LEAAEEAYAPADKMLNNTLRERTRLRMDGNPLEQGAIMRRDVVPTPGLDVFDLVLWSSHEMFPSGLITSYLFGRFACRSISTVDH